LVPPGALEDVPEPVEAVLQHPPVRLDPLRLTVQPARSKATVSHPPDLLRRHQLGRLEDTDMLPDSCQRHLEILGQLADRGIPAPEALEDSASRRVGQGAEGGVELW
jgi:hypothetical protein